MVNINFGIETDGVRRRLASLMGWFQGCSHARTSFPITLPVSRVVGGVNVTEAETYIVCLECGRHLNYDWNAMCVATQARATVATDRAEEPYRTLPAPGTASGALNQSFG